MVLKTVAVDLQIRKREIGVNAVSTRAPGLVVVLEEVILHQDLAAERGIRQGEAEDVFGDEIVDDMVTSRVAGHDSGAGNGVFDCKAVEGCILGGKLHLSANDRFRVEEIGVARIQMAGRCRIGCARAGLGAEQSQRLRHRDVSEITARRHMYCAAGCRNINRVLNDSARQDIDDRSISRKNTAAQCYRRGQADSRRHQSQSVAAAAADRAVGQLRDGNVCIDGYRGREQSGFNARRSDVETSRGLVGVIQHLIGQHACGGIGGS